MTDSVCTKIVLYDARFILYSLLKKKSALSILPLRWEEHTWAKKVAGMRVRVGFFNL